MSWTRFEPTLKKIQTLTFDCQPACGGLAEIRFADSHPHLSHSPPLADRQAGKKFPSPKTSIFYPPAREASRKIFK